AVAIGYGQAYATAITLISDSTITAAGDVDITSTAVTEAFVKARAATNANPIDTGIGGGGDAWALAIAVANTRETAHTTVSAGSTVTSDGGVHIGAYGEVLNFAWAQPTLNDDGTVAVALAFDFDVADIRTVVDGTVDA